MNISDADVICLDADNTLIKYSTKEFCKLQFVSLAKCVIKLGGPAELLTLINLDEIFKISSIGAIADFHTGHLLKIGADCRILRSRFGLEEAKNLEELYGSPPMYHLEQFDKYFVAGERLIHFTHFSVGGSALWQVCVELMKQGKYQISDYVALSEVIRNAVHMNYLDEDRTHSEYYTSFYSQPHLYLTKVTENFKENLVKLRNSGKKLVVVTNSYVDYTNFIFEYCFGKNWHSYFDAYVFGAGKPDFFLKEDDMEKIEHLFLDGEAFQKGSSKHLKESIPGHKYVFVGDHYIGDMHSPKMNNWHTVALIEEVHYEKSILGPCSVEVIENTPHCIFYENDPVDYYETWGSHFNEAGVRTYWWDFIATHADIIIPTMESIFSCFNI